MPLQAVAETAAYLRDAKAAGLTEAEREAIVSAVSADPEAGEEVVGSGGLRKRRVAGRGKGKSGRYRIRVAYAGREMPVYIVALLSKGERANFSPAEIVAMRQAMDAIRSRWAARARQR